MADKDISGIMGAFIAQQLGSGSRLKATPNHPRYANSNRNKLIEQIYSRATADMADIRKNDGLTEKGKAQALAAKWKAANAEISNLSKAERDEHIRRYNAVEQQLFGASKVAGADAEAARNATAIADSLTGSKAAMNALDTAARNGDATLARAIAYRSWQSGWNDVIDVYAERTPGLQDRLSELSDLHDHLTRASVFSRQVPKPIELNKIPPNELNQYVNADPQQTIDSQLTSRFWGGITPTRERELREQAAAEARGDAQ